MMKRVGDVLSAIFDETLVKKAEEYSTFFSCWKDLTEKNGITAAADHSWIRSLDKGLVWIEVDHPGWKQILQTKESKLLSDFRYRFPEMDISGISIVLYRPGSRQNETRDSDSRSKTPVPEQELPPENFTPEPAAMDNAGYGAIRNEALKDALMQLEQSIVIKEKEAKSSNNN